MKKQAARDEKPSTIYIYIIYIYIFFFIYFFKTLDKIRAVSWAQRSHTTRELGTASINIYIYIMIIIDKPFIFDEFRNYVFIGDKIIVDINPNGRMILKEAITKDLRMNSVGAFEAKTKYGWITPKWKVPFQDLNDYR